MTFTEESKNIIQTALIAIIVSLSITVTPGLFDQELKDYYVCDLTLEISEFKGGISGTAYSGYPYIDSRKAPSYCGSSDNKGAWMSLSDYAAEVGLDPYDLIVPNIDDPEPYPVGFNAHTLICSMRAGCFEK